MQVLRDVTAEHREHARLATCLAEAQEVYTRLAARVAADEAATTWAERIKHRTSIEHLVGQLASLGRDLVMSASNPAGTPGRFISGDQADEEITRRRGLMAREP